MYVRFEMLFVLFHSRQTALAASTVAYRGYLIDCDCRICVLEDACDCRTKEERGLEVSKVLHCTLCIMYFHNDYEKTKKAMTLCGL